MKKKKKKKMKKKNKNKNVHTAFTERLMVMLNLSKDLTGATCSGKVKLLW